MTGPCLTRRFVLVCIALLACSAPALARAPEVFQSYKKIAVSGYDVVAYFTKGKPVAGSDSFTANHAGATWRFMSAAHRDLFTKSPEKYIPQYGGYCAYAVSQGATATTIPEAWSIVDEKLYLNYSLAVRKGWESDKLKYIKQADANWPDVLN